MLLNGEEERLIEGKRKACAVGINIIRRQITMGFLVLSVLCNYNISIAGHGACNNRDAAAWPGSAWSGRSGALRRRGAGNV